MRLRTILLVLALLAFMSASIGGYLYYHSLKEFAFKEADRQAASRARRIGNRVASTHSENQKIVMALAMLKEIELALVHPDEKSLAQANSQLDHFHNVLGLNVCYLMDTKGNTIASSNRNEPDSFVGKNYGFRFYFRQAISGTPAVYMALGVTSKKRGVYYSHPVYAAETEIPVGVVVIKSSVASMEQEFIHHREGIALLTDANGVIFASSRKDWLYHVLWKISDETASEIAKARQFGDGPWEWTGLKKTDQNRAVDESGNEYLLYRVDIDNYPGWYVTYLVSRQAIHKLIFDPLVKTGGTIILILCILIGSSVFLLYRAASLDIIQRKVAEEALRESEERFRAISGTAADAIILMDNQGRISYWNPAAESMFGYSPAEAMGRELHLFLAPEEVRGDYERAFREFKQSGSGPVIGKTAEFMAVKKDGSRFPIEVSTSALKIKGKWHAAGILRDISERKRAEEEIRKLNEGLEERVIQRSAELFESEQRHRSLLEASADAIVVYDMEGRVTYLNPAFTHTFGWSSDELMGKPIDFVPEESRPETKAALDRMRQGEKVRLFETKLSTKDGKLLDIQLSSSLFQDRDGFPAGNIVILRDVTASKRVEEALRQAHHDLEQRVTERTSELVRANEQLTQEVEERKRAEEALRESEKQYRNLVDNALVGIYKTDLAGNILYVNDALIRMMGFECPEDMQSVSVLARYRNLTERHRLIEVLGKTGKVNDFETELVTKSGAVKNVIMTAVLEENIISGMILDISERRQAVDECIRLATAVEQAAESVIISDRRGTIQYVNPAFERLSGFTKEDIVGHNFRVLKSDRHDEAFYRKMWTNLSNGETWAGRINNRMKDGSLREFETTISPVRDGSGNIVNFVSVNRDVTQEIALEAQLLHAQKMEAVGTLAGGIAHDFNNLLQVIQGYTEVLLHDLNQGQPGYEPLNKIHRSAKRGAELTSQLLTFSRKVQSERRPLDLNKEVEQVRNLLERTIPKMIEIELYLSQQDTIVSADPIQVEQALMNLAVNAMDAMPEGGKIIFETGKSVLDERFCKAHLGSKPGEYVLLSISDTGHGMDKEILEHVFEPFYTTKEVGKGTGLGLAMVYGIVKNHDGYILCYSELNRGTTFKIYLPALHQDGQKKETDEIEAQLVGGNETILLVDDEEYIRELGVELLSDVGYKVLTATDGESGLTLYRQEQERIDLVVLDLVIPGMGGKKCYEEILKINAKAKILIVSGYSANGPGKEALEAGARGFVGKPFDVIHLLEIVRKILDED